MFFFFTQFPCQLCLPNVILVKLTEKETQLLLQGRQGRFCFGPIMNPDWSVTNDALELIER